MDAIRISALVLLLACVARASFAADPPCAVDFANAHEAPGEISFPDPADRQAYQRAISQLNATTPPGTLLDFGAGHQFRFEGFLGEGATTKIVKTQSGEVLRINRGTLNAYPGTDLASFVGLQRQLKAAGVPIVNVDAAKTYLPKYVVVEEKKILGTLAEMERPGFRGWTDQQRAEALAKLDDFARRTWGFTYIGGFNGSQIGYDGKDWFLFDVELNNTPIKHSHQKGSTFDPIDYDGDLTYLIDPVLSRRLSKITEEERLRHATPEEGPWFKRFDYKKDHDFLVSDNSEGLSSRGANGYELDQEFLTKKGKKKLYRKVPAGVPGNPVAKMTVKSIAKTGKNSVLYEVQIGKEKALLELTTRVESKKDLFNEKPELLKDLGYKKDDFLAIGPDYAIVSE